MTLPALVIFDCDGVLVDSEPIAMRIFLETVRAAGCPMDEQTGYRQFLGRSLASAHEHLRADFGIDLQPAALTAMRHALYEAFRAGLRPTRGIVTALKDLRQRGIPFCVASSSQPERIALSLEVTGLARYFGPHLFSASMVRHGKPAPDLFLHAAASMGYPPADCLVIEDSAAGIQAAQAAGMRVVGFTGGGHAQTAGLAQVMTALRPDAMLDDMAELAEIMQGWRC